MSEQVKKRAVGTVALSQVIEDPYKCPRCGSRNIEIDGKYQRAFRKTFEDGKEVNIVLSTEFVERYVSIDCAACNIVYEIQPDHTVNLLLVNMKLHEELATAKGLTVTKSPDRVM